MEVPWTRHFETRVSFRKGEEYQGIMQWSLLDASTLQRCCSTGLEPQQNHQCGRKDKKLQLQQQPLTPSTKENPPHYAKNNHRLPSNTSTNTATALAPSSTVFGGRPQLRHRESPDRNAKTLIPIFDKKQVTPSPCSARRFVARPILAPLPCIGELGIQSAD